jgi:sortase (surface protein transpeptidase)
MGISPAPNAGNHRGLMAAVVTGVLALSGLSLIGYAVTHQEHAPQPPLSAVDSPSSTPSLAPTSTRPSQAPTSTSAPRPPVASQPPRPATIPPKVVGQVMSVSEPRSVSIPAIGVKSSLLSLGLTAQGTLEVPAPGPDYNKAAWYRHSPTPGALGPAVILGHIDSKEDGPSVFYRLGGLRPGDKVQVTRADGSVAVFAVSAVQRFRKSAFPTQLVYGNTDHAALRLITCGGPFDRDTGSYSDNIVVMAKLVSGSGAAAQAG